VKPLLTPLATAIRPPLARTSAVLVWVVGAIALVTVLGTVRGWDLVIWLALIAAGAIAAGIGAWRPCVAFDESGTTLVNLTRAVRVPWTRLSAIEGGLALVIEAGEDRHTSWAITGQTRRRPRGAGGPPGLMGVPGKMERFDVTPPETRVPDAGSRAATTRAVAEVLHEQWEMRRAHAPDEPIEVVWLWQPLVALGGCLLAAVLAVLAS
jgi:hypothetical protein